MQLVPRRAESSASRCWRQLHPVGDLGAADCHLDVLVGLLVDHIGLQTTDLIKQLLLISFEVILLVKFVALVRICCLSVLT